MDFIIQSPGLHHIAENIFKEFNQDVLSKCGNVNEKWMGIIQNPWFWYKKCVKNDFLTQKQQKRWSKVINALYKCPQNNLTNSLIQIHSSGIEILDCQDPFDMIYVKAAKEGNEKIIEILAPRFRSPNKIDSFGNTPIHWAASNGHSNIVQILASLTANPNAPGKFGQTPIMVAAKNGHANVINILAPLIENPNASDPDGQTPIIEAAKRGHLNVVEILAPLTTDGDDPNAQNPGNGYTPIHYAVENGHLDVVKCLLKFTKKPIDLPAKNGKTPIAIARSNYHGSFNGNGNFDIIKVLNQHQLKNKTSSQISINRKRKRIDL